jgi:hypothetical protein
MERVKTISHQKLNLDWMLGFVFTIQMQEPNYEQAFLTQLDIYSKMFGVRWVVNLCHTFIMNSLAKPIVEPLNERPLSLNERPLSPTLDVKIETDSLCDELPSFIPKEEATLLPLISSSLSVIDIVDDAIAVIDDIDDGDDDIVIVDDDSKPAVKILRLKKTAPLDSPTHSSPQAKQILKETVKKTSSPKKRAAVRDMTKLVKCGFLPPGTKVVPSAPEIKPEIYGIIRVNALGKVGIQPSWNLDTLYVGKSNAPIQFLAAVNKQYPSGKVYGRENAWNDLLKVNPTGGYVSFADLWLQSR